MNERIKQLAEKSGLSYLSSVHPSMWEKFAELIVQECADIAAGERSGWEARNAIEETFRS